MTRSSGETDVRNSCARRSTTANVATGVLAGCMGLMATYPLQAALTVLESDVISPESGKTEHHFRTPWSVWSKTIQHSGTLGLYAGLGMSLAGIAVYRAIYFGLYDLLAPLRRKMGNSVAVSFAVAWTVTTLASLLTYPLDTVRCGVFLAGDPGGAVSLISGHGCRDEQETPDACCTNTARLRRYDGLRAHDLARRGPDGLLPRSPFEYDPWVCCGYGACPVRSSDVCTPLVARESISPLDIFTVRNFNNTTCILMAVCVCFCS